jgi:hypothetical protein
LVAISAVDATAVVVWLMAAVVKAFQGWMPMQGRELGWLSLCLLWVVLLGYFAWGALPNAMGWCAIARESMA